MPTPKQVKERKEKNLQSLESKLNAIYTPKTPIKFSEDPNIRFTQMYSLYYLMNDKIKIGSFLAPEDDEETKENSFQNYAKMILKGTYSKFKDMMKIPEKYRNTIIADLVDDDPSVQKSYLTFADRLEGYVDDLVEYDVNEEFEETAPNQPAPRLFTDKTAKWEKLLFGPKVDSSGYKITTPALKEAHQKADNIEIPIPDGLDEKFGTEFVTLSVMSEFFKTKNLYDVGKEVNSIKGDVSTTQAMLQTKFGNGKPEDYYLYDGTVFTLDNTLSFEDTRDNGYVPRLWAPKYRENVQKLLASYPENRKAVAEHMKEAFDNLLKEAVAATQVRSKYLSYLPAETAVRLYDMLNSPELKGQVIINDRDKQIIEFLRTDVQITNRVAELEKEINNTVLHHNLYGYDKSPSEDNVLKEKLLEYKALQLYEKRKYEDAENILDTIKNLKSVGISYRDLYSTEKAISRDPKGYIEHLKDVVLASPENQELESSLSKGWSDVASSLKAHMSVGEKIAESESSILTPEFERQAMYPSVKESIRLLEEYLVLPKNSKIVGASIAPYRTPEKIEKAMQAMEMLKALPCMHGEFMNPAMDEETLNKIADKYEQVRQFIDEQKFEFSIVTSREVPQENGTVETVIENTANAFLGDKTAIFARGVKEIRGFSKLWNKEKSFYGASFEEVEKAVEERTANMNEGIKDYGNAMICGHPDAKESDALIMDSFYEAHENLSQYEEFNVAMDFLKDTSDRTQNLKLAYAALSTLQDKFSEKMLDDDSETLMQSYSQVTRVMAAIEVGMDAKKPVSDPTPYQNAYDNLDKQIEQMEFDINSLNPESKMHDLAIKAREGLKHIKEAVSNECFGDIENGFKTLESSDAFAAVTAYQLICNSKNPQFADYMEANGVNKLIQAIDASPQMQGNKNDLTIGKISGVASKGLNFLNLLKEPQAKVEQVQNEKAIDDPTKKQVLQ